MIDGTFLRVELEDKRAYKSQNLHKINYRQESNKDRFTRTLPRNMTVAVRQI